MIHRTGEENLDCQFFRSDRLIQINQNWFFLTRGGQQEGPYATAAEAKQFLQMFLSLTQTELSDNNKPEPQLPRPAAGISKETSTTGPTKRTFPFAKVASVVKPPFKVRRIEFTAVAQDVSQVSSKASNCANDSFHFCCL